MNSEESWRAEEQDPMWGCLLKIVKFLVIMILLAILILGMMLGVILSLGF